MKIRHFLLPFVFSASLLLPYGVAAHQQSCPGAPPTRLHAGGSGKLSFTPTGSDPTPVRLREVPGKSGRVVGQMRGRATFRILSGPQCKDNIAWWQVVGQGTVGWIAEGDSSGYFVEPTDTTLPTDQGGAPSDATPILLPTPTLSP